VPDQVRYGALSGSIDGYNAFYGTLTTATIFVIVLMILALADLRAWHYNALRHLQRAEEVIAKMQQTPHSSAQGQQILSNYLVSKEVERTYRSSSSATVSNRTGVLMKPTAWLRRQTSNGSVTPMDPVSPALNTTTRSADSDLESGITREYSYLFGVFRTVHVIFFSHVTSR
jgi:hypothetical protein